MAATTVTVLTLLGAAGAPSTHVSARVLLTFFQSGTPEVLTDVVLGAAALSYLLAVRRLHRRGRRWPLARTAAFVGGSALIFVALGSGLAAYDDLNVSAHVVQHLLLMMLAPPLLVLGRPLVVWSQAAPRGLQLRLVHLSTSRLLRLGSGPAGWLLFYGWMVAYFLTPLYPLSIRNDAFHAFSHASFLAVGCFYWLGVVGEGPVRRPSGRRIALLLAGMPVEAALGLALMVWPRPLSVNDTVAATHEAGQLLWMASMVVSGAALVALVVQWAAADTRATRRRERGNTVPIFGLAAGEASPSSGALDVVAGDGAGQKRGDQALVRRSRLSHWSRRARAPIMYEPGQVLGSGYFSVRE